VSKKLLMFTLVFALGATACSKSNDVASANSSTTQQDPVATRPAPDNSEITASTDASGTRTETRVFRDNKRVSKVVVTTRNGSRTVKAYSTRGEEKDLKDETTDALVATGDAVADAAGFAADKGEDIAGEVKDKTVAIGEKVADGSKTVADKTVDGAKTVKEKTVDGAKTVTEKSVDGAKTAGSAAKTGVKKAGRAIKKVIP
jgi:hypothetical protein